MKKGGKSPVKKVSNLRGHPFKPFQEYGNNYGSVPNYVKPGEPTLASMHEFLKITSISPARLPVPDQFSIKKYNYPNSESKTAKACFVIKDRGGSRGSELLREGNTLDLDATPHKLSKKFTASDADLRLSSRDPNRNSDLTSPIERRPFSKKEHKPNDLALPAINASSNDDRNNKDSKRIRDAMSVDYRPIYSFSVPNNNVQRKSNLLEGKPIQPIGDSALLKSPDNIKKTKPPLSDITDLEKKKIEMTFKYHMASLNRLIQERIKNYSILTGKPSIKSKAQETGLARSQTFESSKASLMGDPVYEEIWRNLKRFASTKSKYKYRDINNYEKKVLMTMKTLLGKAGDYGLTVDNNKSPKNKTNLNLEDETEKSHKKARSPEKKNIAAYTDFIARQKENPGGKIFIIIGGYPDLRKALEDRGWIENPDPYSKNFHLKWALKKIDINYEQLQPHQLVNHFDKNITVTTKVGLARNIKNLIWHQNENIDEIFPKCYDLNDVGEFDDFVEEFKFGQAIAILRNAFEPNKVAKVLSSTHNLYKLKVAVAIDVCTRRMRPFEDIVIEMMKSEDYLLTQEEWEIMTMEDANILTRSLSKYEKLIKQLQTRYGIAIENNSDTTLEESIQTNVNLLLHQYESYSAQSNFNKGKNAWIVKPANLSRGRGIGCYNDLSNLLEHVKVRECEWVAQKYIENPLIAKNKKLDIRQWVLVTDWAPLTIWFYEECYIRFTANDYNPDDFNNKFSHLTNNSIAKYAQNFETSEIEGNMWSCQEFSEHIKSETGQDLFYEKIQPQMKKIVIKSLQSVQDMMESRKNSFELFGYDFLIDDTYKPWLIEINSSPTMEYSTPVTARLVKMVMEDAVKVLIDYGMSKSKNKKNINTGLFKCICNGKPLV